jgi:Fe-S oxidoreductase
MPIQTTIFRILFAISLILFAWSCYKRFSLVTLGKAENRFRHFFRRIWAMLLYAFGQKRVVSRIFGFNHFVIFWSFIILLIANGEFLVTGLFPSISLSRLPKAVHNPIFFILEIISLLTLASILVAFGRRIFFPPSYLSTPYVKARSFEAFLILAFIGLLMIAFFGVHSSGIALGKEAAGSARPISSFVARLMDGARPSSLEVWHGSFWWLHGLVLLAFINFLPISKHMHIMTSIPNCFFQSLEKPNTQPQEVFKKGNIYGVGRVDLFTWKDLFDSYSCTECGRCQDVCPATNTEKPLNPREVVHDIKINLLKNGDFIKKGENPSLALIGDGGEGSNPEDALWSCTTCGACMEVCPVFIEHMPKIIKMRRHLVEMEAKFPEQLLNLFENMEQRSNPWGIAPTERVKWASGSSLEVKQFSAAETEYLFYVGCAGSFDSRNKQVTLAIARILNDAGISWGILGKDERCCGDSLRRLGNEFIFDRMAKENVKLFQEKGVKKVITQCPHCFNTLKNDYRQFGLELEVTHHSELVNKLLEQGRIKIVRKAENLGKLVFHDSCYLGRHNEIYESPRQAITKATGQPPLEMKRNKTNSFCCGAGGGRMWMEESLGTRINLTRVKEALVLKPDTLAVTCPYCMTMFEDGLKDEKAEKVKVKDVAEIIAEGLG